MANINLRQRQPRETNPRFLAFVRQQRCCVCDHWPPVQASHIRMGNITRGVRKVGMGERPSDCHAVPLCADCHLDGPGALHKVGEAKFWARKGINPFVIAEALYTQFHGTEA